MADRGWKQAERRMAKDVGTQRIPVTGERDGADFADSLCVYQLKVRKCIPGWLWVWLTGIRTSGLLCRPNKKIGVLVLKHPRQQDADALVVLTWAQWVELHGDARKAAERGEEGERVLKAAEARGNEIP